MTATHMPTPCGFMPIRKELRDEMAGMNDRQIAENAFSGPFIAPEYYAELMHRGLAGPGISREETTRLIEQRLHDDE